MDIRFVAEIEWRELVKALYVQFLIDQYFLTWCGFAIE